MSKKCKSVKNGAVLIAIALLLSYCAPRETHTRTLYFVDITQPENTGFYSYPEGFVSQILKQVLSGTIEAININYDSAAVVNTLSIDDFTSKLVEPHEEYFYRDEPDANEPLPEHDLELYINEVSLVSFDRLSSETGDHTLFVNFYHPGHVTLEGINRYICSVAFDDAMAVLDKSATPLLWIKMGNPEWGWYAGNTFISDLQTSSRLANDLLASGDSLPSGGDLSISKDSVHRWIEDMPEGFKSRVISMDNGNLRFDISFTNDSLVYRIGQFDEEVFRKMLSQRLRQDAVILPVSKALLEHKYVSGRESIISTRGKFENSGLTDAMATGGFRSPPQIRSFEASDVFRVRAIEKFLEEPAESKSWVQLIYQAVRSGEITVYQSDSLANRMLPGDFFNRLLPFPEDQRMLTEHLMVYQLISDVTFQHDGKLVGKNPVGIGVYLPGRWVPEGFNRPVGFFKIEEVYNLLKDANQEAPNFGDYEVYPLSRWNVTSIREEEA